MKIKLDENLPMSLKPALAAFGIEASTAADEGLLHQPDEAIEKAARSEARMVFTLDLDFGDLRKFPPGRHCGVVLFRPRSMGPGTVTGLIEEFVRESDLNAFVGCLVVVEPGRIRVRRPPANAGEM